MKTMALVAATLLVFCSSPSTEDSRSKSKQDASRQGDSWTIELKERSKRGSLHDAFEKVRGDSGKWNDEPLLTHASPIEHKPEKMPLDGWFDLQIDREDPITSNDDSWLLLKTRQLDDNDRVWIERIERRGDEFTVVLDQAIWQGRYSKSFTYYNVYGVNLGKLPPGKYKATWVIKPLEFRQFEGDGRSTDKNRKDNWPKDEQHAGKKKDVSFKVEFTVAPLSR